MGRSQPYTGGADIFNSIENRNKIGKANFRVDNPPDDLSLGDQENNSTAY